MKRNPAGFGVLELAGGAGAGGAGAGGAGVRGGAWAMWSPAAGGADPSMDEKLMGQRTQPDSRTRSYAGHGTGTSSRKLSTGRSYDPKKDVSQKMAWMLAHDPVQKLTQKVCSSGN